MSTQHSPEPVGVAGWQELWAEAQGKPWLLALLRRHGAGVYQRFVVQYRRLLAQPARRIHRLQRRLGLGMAGVALVLALAGVGLGPRQAFADSITVDGVCTLVDAITAANTDTTVGSCVHSGAPGADTITLGVNVSLTDINNSYFGATGLPVVATEITIDGAGHTISRSSVDNFRILAVNSAGNLTLESATISGGATQTSGVDYYQSGGGIYSRGTLSVWNSTLSGNSAAYNGGGIYIYDGSVGISNSTLSGNDAAYSGGGMFNLYGGYGSVEVSNTTLSGNSAGWVGGAIANEYYITVTNSILTGNSASYGGGGMSSYTGAYSVLAFSTLSGNSATLFGGGVLNFYSYTFVYASTLSGNAALFGGGAVNGYASIGIVNSTLSGNTAVYGAGVGNPGDMFMVASTISGNTAVSAGGGLFNAIPLTVTVQNSTLSGGPVALDGSTFSQGFAALQSHKISGRRDGQGPRSISRDLPALKSRFLSRMASLGARLHGDDPSTPKDSTLSANPANGPSALDYTVELANSLISGNTAPAGSEVYNPGGVYYSQFSLFGHSGENDAQAFYGFTPDVTDINATSDGTNDVLASILSGLGSNGGPTKTHALPPGSPAIDKTPDIACMGSPFVDFDQRGEPRNVDGDGSPSSNECDIGAFERQPSDGTPPAAEAAGPYSGNEGSPIALDGSGSTPSASITHYLWDCTNDGVFESGAAATANCTYPDNGPYTALLRVIDTTGQTDEDTADVTVGNVPPTATFVAPGSVNEGSPIVAKLTNPVDPSSADTLAGFKHAFDCGNGVFSGFASANSRSCPTTDNGTRNVRGKIQDKDLGTTAYAKLVTVNNVPPSATFSAPASVNEGSAFQLALTNRSDPSSADTAAGFKQGFDCGDGVGFNAWGAGTTRSCAAPADGPAARTVKGRIRDKDLGANSYSAGLSVKNVAPSAKFLIAVVKGTNKFTLKLTTPTDPSAPDRAAGFTYSFNCGNGVFSAYSATTSRTCVGVVGTTYTVQGRIRDKDGGIRTYSVNLRFTLSPSGQIEPLIDARSMVEVESQEE